MRARVELFERIRKDRRWEQLSIRELADAASGASSDGAGGVGRSVPPPRKVRGRTRPASGPWIGLVRGWLEADLAVPRKQRHTARRVWQRLIDEHGAGVSESTIRSDGARAEFEIGLDRRVVAVPQTHAGPGAEVDFGEFLAVIDGNGCSCTCL